MEVVHESAGAQPRADALAPLGKGAWGNGPSGCPLLLLTSPGRQHGRGEIEPEKRGLIHVASRRGRWNVGLVLLLIWRHSPRKSDRSSVLRGVGTEIGIPVGGDLG